MCINSRQTSNAYNRQWQSLSLSLSLSAGSRMTEHLFIHLCFHLFFFASLKSITDLMPDKMYIQKIYVPSTWQYISISIFIIVHNILVAVITIFLMALLTESLEIKKNREHNLQHYSTGLKWKRIALYDCAPKWILIYNHYMQNESVHHWMAIIPGTMARLYCWQQKIMLITKMHCHRQNKISLKFH